MPGNREETNNQIDGTVNWISAKNSQESGDNSNKR